MGFDLITTALDNTPEPAPSADFVLDADHIRNLYVAAALRTPDVAEQSWIVAQAVKCGWTPERLAERIGERVPEPLGMFDHLGDSDGEGTES